MTINPTKGDITKPMPIKWQMLVDMMPHFKWVPSRAALAVNPETGKALYSKSYVNSGQFMTILNDIRFLTAVEKKKKEIEAKTGWNQDRWLNEMAKQYDKADENGDVGNARGCLQEIGKHKGYYEADNSQKGDNRTANIMFFAQTPQKAVESTVVDAEQNVIDTTEGE